MPAKKNTEIPSTPETGLYKTRQEAIDNLYFENLLNIQIGDPPQHITDWTRARLSFINLSVNSSSSDTPLSRENAQAHTEFLQNTMTRLNSNQDFVAKARLEEQQHLIRVIKDLESDIDRRCTQQASVDLPNLANKSGISLG